MSSGTTRRLERDTGVDATVPLDEADSRLLAHARPDGWVNPIPAGRYNLVVIGAGTAGLVAAAGAAGLGAKVALIEKHLMGGDCLNVGCVPSKALIRCARAAADVRSAGRFGVSVSGSVAVDFAAVMARMRRLRADIAPNDSVARFRSLGVDVFLGEGRFTGPETISVDGNEIRFARAVIATGARAFVPAIKGLADVGFLTNETVFALTELPRRLVIIGAGPIGCEMAQAFARFGSAVTLIEADHRIMPRDDERAARIVSKALEQDGVQIVVNASILLAERVGSDKIVAIDQGGVFRRIAVDQILVGVGRSPNVEGLNLDRVGIRFDSKTGVQVDDYLRTTNKRVLAAGDVCSRFKFTHAADAMARVVVRNALFRGRAKVGALVLPWCTYTDPEVAHVGLQEPEAAERGIATTTIDVDLSAVDRAILDGAENGFLSILCRKGTDQPVGATLVARHAGELISELTLAMTAGIGLRKIASTIHPYPTLAEVVKRAADAHNRTRLTPFVKRLMSRYLAWTR